MNDLLSSIPYELFEMILDLLGISSIFALKLTCKKYLKSKKLPLDRYVFELHQDIISNGYIDLYKWFVHQNECKNKLSMSHSFYVLKSGKIEIMKYLFENGCKFTDRYGQTQYAAEDVCKGFDEQGNLEILKYLHDNGYHLNNACHRNAIKNGHLEVLKFLHENGSRCDGSVFRNAAEYGQMEILKYLHENGCEWGGMSACYWADQNDHLDVIKYLHDIGCPCEDDYGNRCNYCNELIKIIKKDKGHH